LLSLLLLIFLLVLRRNIRRHTPAWAWFTPATATALLFVCTLLGVLPLGFAIATLFGVAQAGAELLGWPARNEAV
jgi:hypothetical protein